MFCIILLISSLLVLQSAAHSINPPSIYTPQEQSLAQKLYLKYIAGTPPDSHRPLNLTPTTYGEAVEEAKKIVSAFKEWFLANGNKILFTLPCCQYALVHELGAFGIRGNFVVVEALQLALERLQTKGLEHSQWLQYEREKEALVDKVAHGVYQKLRFIYVPSLAAESRGTSGAVKPKGVSQMKSIRL